MAGQNNNVFHIEFGFNETPLTSLLEAGSYREAEKLILENAHASYLDEGCYERTPLNIVLCGKDVNSELRAVRNLYIAKCLVQHGASPNYRVAQTAFGYYVCPGETPLELLIRFFNGITTHDTCNNILEEKDNKRTKHRKWDAEAFPVIGMNHKKLTSLEDVKEDILALVFIMLSHGGDCNVLNELRQTLLHRTAAYSSDARMLQCLCENGADINAVDVYGDTALIYLCRYCQLTQYHIGEINVCNESPYMWARWTLENCCTDIKMTFIQALLQCADIQVDVKNKYGKTALFYCMERGDWRNALLLLQKGCSVNDQGQVSEVDDFYKSTSPLFISMYSSQVMKYFQENYMADSGVQGLNQMFCVPLVDPGYFNDKNITTELCQDIEENMKNVNVLQMRKLGCKVLHLLFGHATCTLRQLCARQVFQCWMKQYSQRVFSLPDGDDAFVSVKDQTSNQVRDSNDQQMAIPHHPYTASMSVPVNDDAVHLSSFRMLNGNFDADISVSAFGTANKDQWMVGESQQDSNDNPGNSSDVNECEDEEVIYVTEEDKLLQVEMSNSDDYRQVVDSYTNEVNKMNGPNDGDSALKNQRLKASSFSSSLSDSSEDSPVCSRISKDPPSSKWPSRLSSLWAHLSQVSAATLDEDLLTVLHLPKDTLICFELELLRVSLFLSRVTRYHRICERKMLRGTYGKGSDESSEEESITDEDESEGEYW